MSYDITQQPQITIQQQSCHSKWACSPSHSQIESLAQVSDLTGGLSGTSSCSNQSPMELRVKSRSHKGQPFSAPEKCMYIVWDRDPKGKYQKCNAYDYGEKYVWYDELFQRLKSPLSSEDEFDEIGRIAVAQEVLEAVDKVERNYFLGVADGSVIKISEKIYVWRIDISHIEEEVILGPKPKLKTKRLFLRHWFEFRIWRRLLRVYQLLQLGDRQEYSITKSVRARRHQI